MKKKLLQHDTNKLFYNKYLYCLTVYNQLGPIFRNKNFMFASTVLDQLQTDLDNGILPLTRWQGRYQSPIDIAHFIDARTIYNVLTRYKDVYLIRCESNTLNFYCNDDAFLRRLSNKLRSVQTFAGPAKEHIEFIRNNTNTIIVKDNTYQYKVTFNSNWVPDTLGPWLKANRDKVKVSDMLLDDLDQDLKYMNGRYIFMTTEKVLMLFKIIAGKCIQRIDKLVCDADIDK